MKLLLLLFIVCVYSISAVAIESGFVYQGKKYITFKDGKKVGPTLEEFKSEKEKNETSSRAPASTITNRTSSLTIMYEEDDLARCYFSVRALVDSLGDTNYHFEKFQLQCVPKRK